MATNTERLMTGSAARACLRPMAARLVVASCVALVFSAACGTAAAAPPVADTMAQRVLACTGCHGPQGPVDLQGFVAQGGEGELQLVPGRVRQAWAAALDQVVRQVFARGLHTPHCR